MSLQTRLFLDGATINVHAALNPSTGKKQNGGEILLNNISCGHVALPQTITGQVIKEGLGLVVVTCVDHSLLLLSGPLGGWMFRLSSFLSVESLFRFVIWLDWKIFYSIKQSNNLQLI